MSSIGPLEPSSIGPLEPSLSLTPPVDLVEVRASGGCGCHLVPRLAFLPVATCSSACSPTSTGGQGSRCQNQTSSVKREAGGASTGKLPQPIPNAELSPMYFHFPATATPKAEPWCTLPQAPFAFLLASLQPPLPAREDTARGEEGGNKVLTE